MAYRVKLPPIRSREQVSGGSPIGTKAVRAVTPVTKPAGRLDCDRQPGGTRPEKIPAGSLLEQCGSDSYAWRMQNVLNELCRLDCPEGMILWLEQVYQPLYVDLMKRLPDKIHQLWSERADLGQFEEVLNQLLQTHRKACALYKGYLAARQKRRASSDAEGL